MNFNKIQIISVARFGILVWNLTNKTFFVEKLTELKSNIFINMPNWTDLVTKLTKNFSSVFGSANLVQFKTTGLDEIKTFCEIQLQDNKEFFGFTHQEFSEMSFNAR